MTNAKAKGKERAVVDNNDNKLQANVVPENSSSLISRVAASATGLARSTLSVPSSTEISDQATATLASAGKASSAHFSQNSNFAWAETSKSASQSTSRTSGLSGFRHSNSEQHVQHADAEFSAFLDGTDPFDSSEGSISGLDVHSSAPDTLLNQAWRRAQLPSAFHGSGLAPVTVAEQESRDGDAVVSFLSGPSTEDAFEAPVPDDENYVFNLSPEQTSKLMALTKDLLLPPPESHGVISPDHPLNLIPVVDGSQVSSTTEEDHWREQWGAVLTRYADEVWGGLLPLVKAARLEMATMGEQGSVETPKALRRLGAILNHLRQP